MIVALALCFIAPIIVLTPIYSHMLHKSEEYTEKKTETGKTVYEKTPKYTTEELQFMAVYMKMFPADEREAIKAYRDTDSFTRKLFIENFK